MTSDSSGYMFSCKFVFGISLSTVYGLTGGSVFVDRTWHHLLHGFIVAEKDDDASSYGYNLYAKDDYAIAIQ